MRAASFLVPVFAALAVAAIGCGPNLDSLRWRAAHDLNCTEREIVLTPLDEDGERWGLRGCDREAAYAWSNDSGKDEWVMVKQPTATAPGATAAPEATPITP
jgi:hypothetical protein